MGNTFIAMFENPYAIKNKVNKFDKIKMKKKTLLNGKNPTQLHVKRQMIKSEKDLQPIA